MPGAAGSGAGDSVGGTVSSEHNNSRVWVGCKFEVLAYCGV